MIKASWIRVKELVAENAQYRFTTTFAAKAGDTFTVRVCADTRYRLAVNGKFADEGPCHGSGFVRYYNTVDLSAFLADGENTVEIDVIHAADGEWISMYREKFAALWFDGLLTRTDGTAEKIRTDDTLRFKAYRLDNRAFLSCLDGLLPSMPPNEIVTGEDVLRPVETEVFYDEDEYNDAGYTGYGLRAVYRLMPRPIARILPREKKPLTLVKDENGVKEYDAGKYVTAYITLTVSAKAGTEITLTSAECKRLGGNSRHPVKGLRDDPNGMIVGPTDTVRFTKDGTLTFKSFYYRAFRYFKTEANAEYTVDAFDFEEVYYPIAEDGKVSTGVEEYEKMWEISRHTLLCCAHDITVDCPFFEQQQYDMDSGLQMLFRFRMDKDPTLSRKMIADMAASQIPGGMLQANYPSTSEQVIPSFSLYWVLMLRNYLLYTGDIAFVKEQMGVAEKIVAGFLALKNEQGLLNPTPYWHFEDWPPEWGDYGMFEGANAESTTTLALQFACALDAAADLAEALGRVGTAADYLNEKEDVIRAVNDLCFDNEAGLYRNTPARRDFCQHTAIWATLSGAVTGKAAAALMEKAMTEPMSRCTFSMNYYLFRALEATGLYDKYAPFVFDGWRKMMDWHCTTWVENPDGPRSECHAWSAAPIYELSGAILGVKPTEPGFASVEIAPKTSWFDRISGTVPTPFGNLEVSWKKQDGKTVLTFKNPAPAEMTVTLRLGKKTVRRAKSGEYTL